MNIVAVIFWGLVALGDLCFLQHILRDGNTDPDARMIWALLVLLLPVVGWGLYLLVGQGYRKPREFNRLHAATRARFEKELDPSLFPADGEDLVAEAFRPLARLLRGCGEGNRVFGGNAFEIITSGLRKRELILEDIRNAKQFIHIEYFRFGNDKAGREVRDLLFQKVAEGVEVRFLNNNMIGRDIPRSYFKEMEEAGMEVLPYTHIRNGFHQWLMRFNAQNHRKVVIIDGRIAYTGGMNLNDNYFYRWRDTHLRITGPVISRLEASFLDSWFSTGGTLKHPLSWYFPADIPQQDAPFKDKTLQVVTDAVEHPWPTTQLGYEWILNNAKQYVYLQTPYFVPPVSVLNALKGAALRGVDVRLMLPLKMDTPFVGPANQSCYEECLEAGVRLFIRGGAFIHSKTLVADDYVTIVGASNLDMRSFHLNSEVNTFIYDRETALASKEIFLSEKENVEELSLEAWRSRKHTWFQDVVAGFLRICYRLL